MTELALARSKAKHPPSKTLAEAEKVKSNVEKSNTKRRPKNMGNTINARLEDLPPLARKYVIENEGGMMLTDARGRNVTPEEVRDLEGQVGELRRGRVEEQEARVAGELDAKATSLMNSDLSLDYSSAMRQAIASDGRFARADAPAPRMGRVYGTDEQLREAVERRMAADPTNYASDEQEDDAPVGSTHEMSDAEYQSEVQRIAKERGYDL